MMTFLRYLAPFCLLLGLLGCETEPRMLAKTVIIEASIENGSTHDLDWVRMEWEGPLFSAGVLPVNIFKTDVDLKWPLVPAGKLTFVDDKTRQRYNISLSFAAINEQIRSGKCPVITIRILDYDRAEIVAGYPLHSGR